MVTKTLHMINPPKTGETPENASGGFLVVMLPGFGPEAPQRPTDVPPDEWAAVMERRAKARGLITTPLIDRGIPLRRALSWLAEAGFPVREEARRFALTIWPEAWDADYRGPEQIKALVRLSDEFVEEVRKRRPKLILFLSCYLMDALQDPTLQAKLEEAIGTPAAPPYRLTDTRLRAEAQRWTRTTVIALPIPGRNTTPEFESALVGGLRTLLRPARSV